MSLEFILSCPVREWTQSGIGERLTAERRQEPRTGVSSPYLLSAQDLTHVVDMKKIRSYTCVECEEYNQIVIINVCVRSKGSGGGKWGL